MSQVGAQLALYFPVLAVWLALVGALVNRERVIITGPLVLAAAVGIAAIVWKNPWLLAAVVPLWLWSLAWMVQAHRRRNTT